MREALDAFFESVMRPTTGKVEVQLFKGRATALGAESPHSLYSEDLATFSGESEGYSHADSEGFVRLYGLPGTVAARVQGGVALK